MFYEFRTRRVLMVLELVLAPTFLAGRDLLLQATNAGQAGRVHGWPRGRRDDLRGGSCNQRSHQRLEASDQPRPIHGTIRAALRPTAQGLNKPEIHVCVGVVVTEQRVFALGCRTESRGALQLCYARSGNGCEQCRGCRQCIAPIEGCCFCEVYSTYSWRSEHK